MPLPLPVGSAARFDIIETLSIHIPNITVTDALTLTDRIISIVTSAQLTTSNERDYWLNDFTFRQHYLENKRISAIKMYRAAHAGMGLKEAKDAVDTLWNIYDREDPRPEWL